MAEQVKYYRHVEEVAPPLPKNSELYGVEYRSFLITRENANYMLWDIKTKDGNKPPLRLRSSFTTKEKAMEEIDSFLAEEKRKENTSDT